MYDNSISNFSQANPGSTAWIRSQPLLGRTCHIYIARNVYWEFYGSPLRQRRPVSKILRSYEPHKLFLQLYCVVLSAYWEINELWYHFHVHWRHVTTYLFTPRHSYLTTTVHGIRFGPGNSEVGNFNQSILNTWWDGSSMSFQKLRTQTQGWNKATLDKRNSISFPRSTGSQIQDYCCNH